MMPGFTGQRRARPGVIASPVSRWADLSPSIRVSRSIRTTVVALRPPALGSLLIGVTPDQLGERLPEPFGGGAAFAEGPVDPAARCLGEAIAQSAFLRIAPVRVSSGEPAVDLAVAVVPDGEPGGDCGRVPLLLLQQFGLVGVGCFGGGDVEDPAAQGLQCFGVERLSLVSSWASALATSRGSRSSGSSARARRMASACSAWTRPSASALAGRARGSEAVREPHRPVCRGPGGAGGDGVPVRGGGGAGEAGDLGAVGVGQDPGLELGDLGGAVELCEGAVVSAGSIDQTGTSTMGEL